MAELTVNMLVKFDPLAAQIAEYKKENADLSFDLEDKEGMKDAKSHVRKLRGVVTAIAKVHKEVKAEALAFGRAVDGKKNQYTAEVKEMVDLWAIPIKEIEEREYRRMAKEAEERAAEIQQKEDKRLADLEAREAAMAAKEQEAKEETARIAKEHADKVAAENEKLRAAQTKLEAEKQALEAEANAQCRERQAREDAINQAEAEKINAAQQAEYDKEQAAKKAEREIQEAIEAAEERHREDQEAEHAERLMEVKAEAKRVANKKHRAKVEKMASQAFYEAFGVDFDADGVVQVISEGNISNVTINY